MWGKFWFRVALFVALLTASWIAPSPQAQAKPVEYVKVCSAYGAGFYYVPGTDTCLRVGSYARTDVGAFSFQTSQGAVCNNRYGRYFTSDAESCGRRPDKPLEYVKVCSVYSSGYYYVPGTDTCIRIGAWVRDNDVAAAPTLYGTTTSGPLSFAMTGGALWTRASSSYLSNGGQTPGSFSSNATGGDFYAQLKYMQQLGNGVSLSFGLNGGVNATGTMTLFDIRRHQTNATNGHVIGTLDSGAVVNPFVELRAPVTPGTYAWIAPGAMFQEQKLSLSSDQTGFGGKLEQASASYWATGFDLRGGVSTVVCPKCFLNQPLILGVGGSATWFNSSQSVDLRSSTFGFTETARVDSTRQYGVQVKLTTPLSFRIPPPPPP
jgi:hypothetical protein